MFSLEPGGLPRVGLCIENKSNLSRWSAAMTGVMERPDFRQLRLCG
jgi:hypothetical protein